MMVKGELSTVSVLPMMRGSLLKRRLQYAWEIITTSSRPGAASSDTNGRPRNGRTPSDDTQLLVTIAPPTASREPSRCVTSMPPPSSPATSAKSSRRPRISSRSAQERLSVGSRESLLQILTSRSGSSYGSGRNTTASTTVKTAEFAPTPRASVSTATAVKAGFLASIRHANDTLRHNSSTEERAPSNVDMVPLRLKASRASA